MEFNENIAKTIEVSEYAKKFNVSVESELGSVGDEGIILSSKAIRDNMTKPNLAREFIDRTKCDALAIAIGNAHGPYVKYPDLDFERLSEINKEINMPLVLHGGSGTSVADFKTAISKGISKINVATAIHNAVGDTIKESNSGNYFSIAAEIEKQVYEVIKNHMLIFGSNERYKNE